MAQGNFELAAIPLHHSPKSEDHRHRTSCLAKLQFFWVRFFLKGVDRILCVSGQSPQAETTSTCPWEAMVGDIISGVPR